MTPTEQRFWRLVERAADRGLLPAASKLVSDLVADHDAAQRIAKRRGRARGGGQSSKAKGRRGAQEAAALIVERLALEPDDVLVKATSMGGVDLHLSPAAQCLLPFGIESKRVESLNIWAALAQAEVNARRRNVPGLVFFSRSHSPMYVALSADDFLTLVAKLHGRSKSDSRRDQEPEKGPA